MGRRWLPVKLGMFIVDGKMVGGSRQAKSLTYETQADSKVVGNSTAGGAMPYKRKRV